MAQWWDGVPGARVSGDHTMGGEVNTEHGSIHIYIYLFAIKQISFGSAIIKILDFPPLHVEALERLQAGGTELAAAELCLQSFESALRRAGREGSRPLRQLLGHLQGQVELRKCDERLEKACFLHVFLMFPVKVI